MQGLVCFADTRENFKLFHKRFNGNCKFYKRTCCYNAPRLLVRRLSMAERVQLTTDGHRAYLNAVEDAFEGQIDFAQLIKLYGGLEGKDNERKYSPAECTGIETIIISGRPDEKFICTSYVERQNLPCVCT